MLANLELKVYLLQTEFVETGFFSFSAIKIIFILNKVPYLIVNHKHTNVSEKSKRSSSKWNKIKLNKDLKISLVRCLYIEKINFKRSVHVV